MSPTTGQIPTRYSPVRHSSARSKLPLLPFDLHVLSMPPAFNLSQDQTLQFKFELSLLGRQILARLSIFFGIEDASSILLLGLSRPPTEHPHKLPNLIVKELPDFHPTETVKLSSTPSDCQHLSASSPASGPASRRLLLKRAAYSTHYLREVNS